MSRWLSASSIFLATLSAGCGPPSAAQAPAAPALAPSLAPAATSPKADQPPRQTELATRKAGVDWPAFLGLTGDGKSPEKGILTDWRASGLKLVWQRPLGEGYGAPTISRGRLFQFDRFGNRERLYCLNAETGEQLWQHEVPTDYQDMYGYNNGPRCFPVVDEDRVYAFGAGGRLICCNAADGKPLWEVDTAKEFGVVQNFFGVGSTPVVEGDLLIVMVGGSPRESQRVPRGQLNLVDPNGTGIVAFDKRSGEVKYKLADELASYASLKLATIGGRRWCFAFCRGGLVGFEPASGQLDFHYPWRDRGLESVNASMPVVRGDEVFISETYGPGSSLLKVAPGKCEVVWKDDDRTRERAMQTHWNTPIEVDGFLYGSSGRHEHNAELRCIEWKSGKVKWSQPGMARCSLTYIDGHFLCLGEYGQLWLLKVNPEKYEEVAMVDYADPLLGEKLLGKQEPILKNPCWAAPIVSHGLLYLRGDERLICLELIP
ncbi:MAG: PQQ-like beta-propeller repeat protein [Planctomycetaceae bacterium]|nr:PQQ-like beta-propeller repeat protein [Planctomycetaceae bacterium]